MANQFARRLRRESTAAERALWRGLRLKQLGGHRFRRQHPIGPYIADFVCLERKLVVEIDGATHASERERAHDEQRSTWLNASGYRVLRLTNDDIYRNLAGALDTLLDALGGARSGTNVDARRVSRDPDKGNDD